MTLRCAVFFREELKPGEGFTNRPVEQARKVPGVKNAFLTLGRFDGVVYIEGSDYRACSTAAAQINKLPGVKSTETLFELLT